MLRPGQCQRHYGAPCRGFRSRLHTVADGLGPSLQHLAPSLYGDDPANWFASGPAPGGANVINAAPDVSLLSPANGTSFPGVATTVSEPAVVTVLAPPAGNGIGLTRQQWDTLVNFSSPGTPFLTRVEATVGFDWGNDSPHASIGADAFSVRWTGQIQPRLTGTYGFYTYSDDRVRL